MERQRDADHGHGAAIAIKAVEGKWKVHIMGVVNTGSLRFGEIAEAVDGLSERVLARQLRQLERDGIVVRTVHPEVPPRVEYALTAAGLALAEALGPLAEWGEELRLGLLRSGRDD
ncbi:winged helix-turn-helix transcriptional regulator [Salininema proteolyticum]|uniref:Winged helix-turn-helix transcriptional regulator n=1 Tax=Salininema proteolyticum TaxID=1607685 RepID=A0ABV8U3P0_9ACTN